MPIRRFATSNWQVRDRPDSGHIVDMAKSTRMTQSGHFFRQAVSDLLRGSEQLKSRCWKADIW